MSIELDSIFRKLPDARYRNVGGEGIVVRQSAGEVLVLSEVGARVLDLIESGKALREMLAVLSAEYEIDPVLLEQDVNQYLVELQDAGIIEIAGR